MTTFSENDLENWITQYAVCVVYFKTKNCGVCTAMLPRIKAITGNLELPLLVVDLSENMHLASSQMVLNVPVTKIFQNSKEIWKEGAFQNLDKLTQLLTELKKVENE